MLISEISHVYFSSNTSNDFLFLTKRKESIVGCYLIKKMKNGRFLIFLY